jgi:hypothetical protein
MSARRRQEESSSTADQGTKAKANQSQIEEPHCAALVFESNPGQKQLMLQTGVNLYQNGKQHQQFMNSQLTVPGTTGDQSNTRPVNTSQRQKRVVSGHHLMPNSMQAAYNSSTNAENGNVNSSSLMKRNKENVSTHSQSLQPNTGSAKGGQRRASRMYSGISCHALNNLEDDLLTKQQQALRNN